MLFEQIQSNKRKTVYLIFLFSLILVGLGSALGYYFLGNILIGTITVSIITLIYVLTTVSNSKKLVMKMNHAKPITRDQIPQLWNVVEDMAMVARIPVPEIYVIEEESPNAFATGWKPESAAIAVTTGLLKKLNRAEVEAVIAHEVAHIVNYDVRLSTVTLALVSVFAIISDYVAHSMMLSSKSDDNKFVAILALIAVILTPIIGMVVHYAVSRNREFLADATGAELCRNPMALASALHKISNDDDPVDNISSSSATLYISDPFKKAAKGEKTSFFATHPPTEERIKRLMNM